MTFQQRVTTYINKLSTNQNVNYTKRLRTRTLRIFRIFLIFLRLTLFNKIKMVRYIKNDLLLCSVQLYDIW